MIMIVTAVFMSSVLFAYLMATGDPTEEESTTYAIVFAAILITLNVSLLVIGIWASRKLRKVSKCASCGAVIKNETVCPKCHTVQVDEDSYLEPKDEEKVIRPKK